MIINLLLAAVFFISMQVQGSVREFDDIVWQAGISDFVVDLSLESSQAFSVSFEQVPGRPLILKFDAPHLVKDARKVDLYLLSSPVRTVEERRLLASVQQDPALISGNVERVGISENVELLINRMAQGDWALLTVESSAGMVREIELPAIDFYHPYQYFNQLRNTLPPLGWGDAGQMTFYFPLGSASLAAADQRRLDDLLAYIHADDRVESVTIDGHTDTSGQRLTNLTLSARRAEAVKDYLLNAGLEREMLQAVRHHGQRFPISGASAAQNRRVEIRLYRSDDSAESENNFTNIRSRQTADGL